jgi:hypothetical protein
MIAHLVLMNLQDPADGPFVAAQIRSLAGEVPGLQQVDGGPSVVSAAASWDLGFLMLFATREAVESYQSHPAHVAVGQRIRARIREMGTCDIVLDPARLG